MQPIPELLDVREEIGVSTPSHVLYTRDPPHNPSSLRTGQVSRVQAPLEGASAALARATRSPTLPTTSPHNPSAQKTLKPSADEAQDAAPARKHSLSYLGYQVALSPRFPPIPATLPGCAPLDPLTFRIPGRYPDPQPAGLAFLAVRQHDEWQEAEIRARLLADKGYDKIIEQLGGKPFLDEIASAHKAYGEALGITLVKLAPESPAIRVARDNAIDLIRSYVLRVAALVRKSDPQTEALSQRLLAPLVHWRDRPAKAAVTDPAVPPIPTAQVVVANTSTQS